MKDLVRRMNPGAAIMLIFFTVLQTVLWAQESTTTSTNKVDVSVERSENWYASPWVWVIGAAVFILLLVALLGGGRGRTTDSSSDKVTVTKTVERDTDV
jgi:hypothetical protein